ncbi:hypothetical protein Q7C36_021604 [Tachysurus vachellii]|uniref:Spermatogenesis-associated protein 2 PUB-like domain-containing protein n=1 Tax=Tachysurus vachellii TaxID=175792 RepID=A0AA88ISL4_TACVA|nr:hypothetical protein Q7C36_021604 [Tachysurus vachellii]
MTNTAGGEAVPARCEDVLERYVTFCSRVWSEGGVKVCEEAQLVEAAKQLLITQSQEAPTFTLLPFYPTVIDIISTDPNSSSTVLRRLSRAFEVLELLCINLFIFPWRKEFKTLKKFTGHFVYDIKSVLPPQTTQIVLHHIGYDSETDTEYRLSDSADPNHAKAMGIELFLARVECERLTQMTSQTSHAECLRIIRSRGSAATLQEEPELDNAMNGVLKNDGENRDDFLLHPEPSLKPLDQEINECENLEHGTFLSEDKSILEMQKDYPDLTFRQRPIFKRSSAKINRSGGRDLKLEHEMCKCETEAPEPALEPQSSEEQQLHVGDASQTPGFKNVDVTSVTDLAEMMDKLKLKEFPSEEPLKCPVEETSQCEKKEMIPIICSPSQESICSIAGCGSCSTSDRLQQHRSITEPPQSFYIPNRVSGSAAAPPADHEQNIHPSSKARDEPGFHHALESL